MIVKLLQVMQIIGHCLHIAVGIKPSPYATTIPLQTGPHHVGHNNLMHQLLASIPPLCSGAFVHQQHQHITTRRRWRLRAIQFEIHFN